MSIDPNRVNYIQRVILEDMGNDGIPGMLPEELEIVREKVFSFTPTNKYNMGGGVQNFDNGGTASGSSGSLGSASSNPGMVIDKDFFGQPGLNVEFDPNTGLITEVGRKAVNDYIGPNSNASIKTKPGLLNSMLSDSKSINQSMLSSKALADTKKTLDTLDALSKSKGVSLNSILGIPENATQEAIATAIGKGLLGFMVGPFASKAIVAIFNALDKNKIEATFVKSMKDRLNSDDKAIRDSAQIAYSDYKSWREDPLDSANIYSEDQLNDWTQIYSEDPLDYTIYSEDPKGPEVSSVINNIKDGVPLTEDTTASYPSVTYSDLPQHSSSYIHDDVTSIELASPNEHSLDLNNPDVLSVMVDLGQEMHPNSDRSDILSFIEGIRDEGTISVQPGLNVKEVDDYDPYDSTPAVINTDPTTTTTDPTTAVTTNTAAVPATVSDAPTTTDQATGMKSSTPEVVDTGWDAAMAAGEDALDIDVGPMAGIDVGYSGGDVGVDAGPSTGDPGSVGHGAADPGPNLAKGGPVNMQLGGETENADTNMEVANVPMGVVSDRDGAPGPFRGGTGVEDDLDMEVEAGSYILNAESVQLVGVSDINKVIRDAYTIAAKLGKPLPEDYDPQNKVPIRISNGEAVIPKSLVDIIGLDKLEKWNQKGLQLRKQKEKMMAKQQQAQPPQQQQVASEAPMQQQMGQLMNKGGEVEEDFFKIDLDFIRKLDSWMDKYNETKTNKKNYLNTNNALVLAETIAMQESDSDPDARQNPRGIISGIKNLIKTGSIYGPGSGLYQYEKEGSDKSTQEAAKTAVTRAKSFDPNMYWLSKFKDNDEDFDLRKLTGKEQTELFIIDNLSGDAPFIDTINNDNLTGKQAFEYWKKYHWRGKDKITSERKQEFINNYNKNKNKIYKVLRRGEN